MLELSTVNDILASIAKRDGETVAMWKSADGWKPIMGRTMYGRVRALAATMESWGVRRGDRVVIMSENRWEWPVVDFASRLKEATQRRGFSYGCVSALRSLRCGACKRLRDVIKRASQRRGFRTDVHLACALFVAGHSKRL